MRVLVFFDLAFGDFIDFTFSQGIVELLGYFTKKCSVNFHPSGIHEIDIENLGQFSHSRFADKLSIAFLN